MHGGYSVTTLGASGLWLAQKLTADDTVVFLHLTGYYYFIFFIYYFVFVFIVLMS